MVMVEFANPIMITWKYQEKITYRNNITTPEKTWYVFKDWYLNGEKV